MEGIGFFPDLPLFYWDNLKWLTDNFMANALRSVLLQFGTTLSRLEDVL